MYYIAEKRAHHNALERKRRDHIKDSFTSLRESVPALQGGKASRAKILKKAAEYIRLTRRKHNAHPQDIDDIRRQNNVLKAQIQLLEKVGASGNLSDAHELEIGIKSEGSWDDTDSSDGEGTTRRVEKLKMNSKGSSDDTDSSDGEGTTRRVEKLKMNSKGSSDDTDSSDGEETTRRVEKLKMNSTNP